MKKFFSPPFIFCILFFLVFPACVSYAVMDPFITPRVILTACTTAVFSLWLFLKVKPDGNIPGVPVLMLAVFLMLYAFSTSLSLNPGDGWYDWMKTFSGLPVLLISAALFKDEEKRKLLLKFSQLTIVILGLVYVYQWIYLFNNPKLEDVFDLRVHIASTLGNKNFYAEVLCFLFPLSVVSCITFRNFWRWLALFNLISIITSLVLTKSYAVFGAFAVSLCISMLLYLASSRGKNLMSIKFLGTGLVVAVLLGFLVLKSDLFANFRQRVSVMEGYISNPEQLHSTSKANSNSTFERLMLWRNTIDLIKESPFRGAGAANWKLMYPKYGVSGTQYIEGGNVHYEHPHNDFLLIAAETGLPGLLALLLFFGSLLWLGIRGIKSQTNRHWHAGILFTVISFLIISLFSFPRVRYYGWMLLCIQSGLLLAMVPQIRPVIKNGLQAWKISTALCALLSCWIVASAVNHFSGELSCERMQHAKQQKNFSRMLREAGKADTWIYPVDESATPFGWYKGMAMFYSGNISGAKLAYEDALRKNPYHIQLLNDFATACEQTNEREKAIRLYNRALEVTPYFAHTLLNISACYFNIGKRDSSFYFIDKVYGIRLKDQEKVSYNSYLPVILREKIYADTLKYPADLRPVIMMHATDTAFVSKAYRKSRQEQISFESSITEAAEAIIH